MTDSGADPRNSASASDLRDLIRDVVHLQSDWSSESSSEMMLRGRLIRDSIPGTLRLLGASGVADGGWAPFDLVVEGKDGIGRKSQVPWVRLYSRSRSKSATEGWYVVYLFKGDASGVYLTLMHASTTSVGDQLIAQEEAFLRDRVKAARHVLGKWIDSDKRLLASIELRAPKSKVSRPYEHSVVAAIEYRDERMTAAADLVNDLKAMVNALGYLYSQLRT